MSLADRQSEAPPSEPQEEKRTQLETVPAHPVDHRTSSRRRAGLPFRVAVVAVVLLGGGTLFLSGYSLGRGAASTPS